HGDVLAESQRVVLVDPGVIARLRAVIAEAFEAGAGIFVEAPAFRAVVAGGVRAVEWALALAPVEAREMAARVRPPRDAVLVDVAAADAEGRQRHVVDFGQSRCGIEANERWRAAEDAGGVPDRAVDRVRHHGIGSRTRHDPLVLGRARRLVGLDVTSAPPASLRSH